MENEKFDEDRNTRLHARVPFHKYTNGKTYDEGIKFLHREGYVDISVNEIYLYLKNSESIKQPLKYRQELMIYTSALYFLPHRFVWDAIKTRKYHLDDFNKKLSGTELASYIWLDWLSAQLSSEQFDIKKYSEFILYEELGYAVNYMPYLYSFYENIENGSKKSIATNLQSSLNKYIHNLEEVFLTQIENSYQPGKIAIRLFTFYFVPILYFIKEFKPGIVEQLTVKENPFFDLTFLDVIEPLYTEETLRSSQKH